MKCATGAALTTAVAVAGGGRVIDRGTDYTGAGVIVVVGRSLRLRCEADAFGASSRSDQRLPKL